MFIEFDNLGNIVINLLYQPIMSVYLNKPIFIYQSG